MASLYLTKTGANLRECYYKVRERWWWSLVRLDGAQRVSSSSLRSYYHGRTETVRSCTVEAIDWCKQMVNKDTTTRLNVSQCYLQR